MPWYFPFKVHSMTISRGACHGETTLEKSRDYLVNDYNSRHKMNRKAPEKWRIDYNCKSIPVPVSIKGMKALAAEFTAKNIYGTARMLRLYYQYPGEDYVWEIEYLGHEPVFSKHKERIIKSLKSLVPQRKVKRNSSSH